MNSNGLIAPYVWAWLSLFSPTKAIACPLCHTSTAHQVRAGLLATSLDGLTILALILPFAVLAFSLFVIHLDWRNVFTDRDARKHT